MALHHPISQIPDFMLDDFKLVLLHRLFEGAEMIDVFIHGRLPLGFGEFSHFARLDYKLSQGIGTGHFTAGNGFFDHIKAFYQLLFDGFPRILPGNNFLLGRRLVLLKSGPAPFYFGVYTPLLFAVADFGLQSIRYPPAMVSGLKISFAERAAL